jgi:hypothetical protein
MALIFVNSEKQNDSEKADYKPFDEYPPRRHVRPTAARPRARNSQFAWS